MPPWLVCGLVLLGPPHLAEGRAVADSESPALLLAPSLAPAPHPPPPFTHSIPVKLSGLALGIAHAEESIPSPSGLFLVQLGLLRQEVPCPWLRNAVWSQTLSSSPGVLAGPPLTSSLRAACPL